MYSLDDTDLQRIDEFTSRRPRHFSLQLLRALLHLKGGPVEGKAVVVCVKPGREWIIARLGARRGAPLVRIDDRTFPSYIAAQEAMFRLRWRERCGDDRPGTKGGE